MNPENATLFIQHRLLALWYAKRWFNRNRHHCYASLDEVVASALYGLWRAILTYDPGRAELSTWAPIWMHKAIVEDCARLIPLGVPLIPELDDRPDQWPGPDDLANGADEREQLQALIRRLPSREQIVIQDQLAEVPATETAHALGITRQRLHQIRRVAYGRLRRYHHASQQSVAAHARSQHPLCEDGADGGSLAA